MHTFEESLKSQINGFESKRSSSHKIELLYAEFQNLKARIHTSTSKRKDVISNSPSLAANQSHARNSLNTNKQQRIRGLHQQKLLEKSQAALKNTTQFFKTGQTYYAKHRKQEIELKYLIRKNIQTFITKYLSEFETEVLLKIENLQRKLKNSEQTIKKIKTIMSIKKLNHQKITKFQTPSINMGNNESLSGLILEYEKKINDLIEDYEQRMEIAEQKGKDKQTYSSTIRTKENKSYEKQMMQKQTQINKLRLNYHKLKRSYDQIKNKYQNCLQKIQQIKFTVVDKMDKPIQVQIQSIELNKLQQEITTLRTLIQIKSKEIQELKNLADFRNQRQEKQKQQIIDSPQIMSNNKIYDNPVTQNNKIKDEQFYTQLQQIQADVSIFNQRITKSQIIQPKRKKEMIESLKSLQLEVNLISEENKHLQSKKALFENQLKNTQVDEERFVQQSNLLKAEIKRLNTSLQLLDKFVYQYIKDGKIDQSKVNDLPQELKSKTLFSDFGKQNQKRK